MVAGLHNTIFFGNICTTRNKLNDMIRILSLKHQKLDQIKIENQESIVLIERGKVKLRSSGRIDVETIFDKNTHGYFL